MNDETAAGLLDVIHRRATAEEFDPNRELDEATIRNLVEDAVCAPSSFNLQHWRFVAVRRAEDRQRLCEAAFNQPQVARAPLTFIVLGCLDAVDTLPGILDLAVARGAIAEGKAVAWVRMARQIYGDECAARDEAIRSASLAAMTMMLAAEARGLVSGALTGFDPDRVRREFGIASRHLPVMLLTIGYPLGAPRPRMPRLGVDDVMRYDRWEEP